MRFLSKFDTLSILFSNNKRGNLSPIIERGREPMSTPFPPDVPVNKIGKQANQHPSVRGGTSIAKAGMNNNINTVKHRHLKKKTKELPQMLTQFPLKKKMV